MQAQAPKDPYQALWSRLDGFDPGELGVMIAGGEAVRAPLMRATIHLVTARDCLALWPLLEPVLARTFKGSPFSKRLGGAELDELLAAGRDLLEERPRMRAELAPLLGERWPDADADSLAYAVTFLLPLVQVPPRGVWGESGRAIWTTVESWLGAPLELEPSLEGLVSRYLGAFGPASVKDIQNWSGLTRLREVIERLRPQLRSFSDEHGVELFDLPEAPRPDPEAPAPIRFLPEYDNVLLGHADRTRVVPAGLGMEIFPGESGAIGTVLVDGFVGGGWRIERERSAATLLIRPLKRFPGRVAAEVAEEGARFLDFAAAGDEPREVRLVPA